ncbi:MAG: hypothetical protein H6862_01150 [Rhodospirillales bacterium]|nr:hypothetical protein [Rhodospirillales bacterium]
MQRNRRGRGGLVIRLGQRASTPNGLSDFCADRSALGIGEGIPDRSGVQCVVYEDIFPQIHPVGHLYPALFQQDASQNCAGAYKSLVRYGAPCGHIAQINLQNL